MIDKDEFRQLLEPVARAVSIYCSIDTNQRDQRAPQTRLRSLIDMAEQQLARNGLDARECAELVEHLQSLVSDLDFARHRNPGLTIFATAPSAAAQAAKIVPLPAAMPELIAVGQNFHIKPLLPLMAADQRFGILALSKGNVKLLTATPFMWADVPLEVLPLEFQAELDARLEATGHGGQGVSDAARKELLVSNSRTIETAVKAAIGDDPMPIVLVADPHVAGSFLQNAEIRQIHPRQVHLNPFALDNAELHARALDVIRPDLDAELEAVIDQLNARLGTAETTVAIRLEEILVAAREGRVDSVVVAEDELLWGSFAETGTLVAHGTPAPGDEDLLNLAAVLTLRTGGRAFAVPRARVPRQVPAAATLRF